MAYLPVRSRAIPGRLKATFHDQLYCSYDPLIPVETPTTVPTAFARDSRFHGKNFEKIFAQCRW